MYLIKQNLHKAWGMEALLLASINLSARWRWATVMHNTLFHLFECLLSSDKRNYRSSLFVLLNITTCFGCFQPSSS